MKTEGFVATIVNMTRFFYLQDFGGFTRTLTEHFLTRVDGELANQVRSEIIGPFLDRFPEATLHSTVGPDRVINPDGATMAINGHNGPAAESETDSTNTIIEIDDDDVEPGEPGYFGTTVAEMIRHEEFAYLGGAPRAPYVEQGTIEASEPVNLNHSTYKILKRAHFCTHLCKFSAKEEGHWSHLAILIFLLLVTTVILKLRQKKKKHHQLRMWMESRCRHQQARSEMSELYLEIL